MTFVEARRGRARRGKARRGMARGRVRRKGHSAIIYTMKRLALLWQQKGERPICFDTVIVSTV